MSFHYALLNRICTTRLKYDTDTTNRPDSALRLSTRRPPLPIPFQVMPRRRTVKSWVSCNGDVAARQLWRSAFCKKSDRVRSALQTPNVSEFFLGETILVLDYEMPSYLFCACQGGIAKRALG